MDGDGYSILDSYTDNTPNDDILDVYTRRTSKFTLNLVSALYDAVLGTFVKKSTITASAECYQRPGLLTSGSVAQDKAGAIAGEN